MKEREENRRERNNGKRMDTNVKKRRDAIIRKNIAFMGKSKAVLKGKMDYEEK